MNKELEKRLRLKIFMEDKMETKKNWLGILAIMFIFGMTVVGNLEAQTDSRLNGIWVSVENGIETKWTFTNGNFETFYDGKPEKRGTFTARDGGGRNSSEGSLRFNTTHVHGSNIDDSLEQRWYTLEELINIFGISEQEDITELYKEFNTQLWYTVNGNTLTTHNTSQALFVTLTTIFTKK